jgi:hypothetical protein
MIEFNPTKTNSSRVVRFSLFTQQGFEENCLKNIQKITNSGFKFELQIDENSSSEELFIMACQLANSKLSKSSLWQLSSDFQVLSPIISSSNFPITNIYFHSLFLAYHYDDVNIYDPRSKLFFIKFFDPEIINEKVFLFSAVFLKS